MALFRCDDTMNRILQETGSDQYKAFISGPDNFRYQIDPNYKANRADKPRPEWLQPVREHLILRWGAHVSDGIEADDNLGIEQSQYWDTTIARINYSTVNTVICSIDKDLLQIPGNHYNFVSNTGCFITEHQGWVNFYTQLIMGDRSDNIPGYDGKMRQKVPQFLQPFIDAIHNCSNELAMYEEVEDMYNHDNGLGHERMMINAQLLYIQRKVGDQFHAPE